MSASTTPIRVGAATLGSRICLVVIVLVIGALIVAPQWASRDWIRLLGEFCAYAALASLWNLLAGYAGLVSVGQQAFVGLGGYVLYALAIFLGINPLYTIPVAGLAAGLIAIPVAMLTFRLRGAYFAIGTWVVAEAFRLFAAQIASMGGGSGLSLPARIVIGIASNRAQREFIIFWVALALFLMVLGLIVLLLRSRYGLALTAIRDNEVAARSNGVDVGRIKLLVYVLVAAATGMVGAWIALEKLRISPDSAFDVNDWTALVIFMTVIGGLGSIEGPIIGCVIFFVMRETLSDLGSVYLMILGAVAIGVMLKAPKGIWGLIADRTGWQVIPLRRRVKLARPG
jgi:branched-chain amino acid transport system permease protein